MSRLDVAQLRDALKKSQSGGGFRLDDIRQLEDFASYARAQAAVVCNVETYEIRCEREVARIDLGMYQGDVEDTALPPVERVARSVEALQDILTAIEQEGIECAFQVWADEL